MIKILLTVLTLTSTQTLSAVSCKEWNQYSPKQLERAEWLYNFGKPDNRQHTLVALAMKESTLGKYRLNLRSGDLGLLQISAKTAADEMGVTNYWKKVELHQELVFNDKLNATIALKVLSHFDKSNYKEMIMSYNEGYQWRKDKKSFKKALTYYNEVAYNVLVVKRCSGFN